MKNIQITKLISLVLKELKRIGLKKTSVDYYETEVFKPILQFFVLRHESYFSYETISDYLAIIQQRHQKNEIGQKHFRALERGIRLLLEFYQNNKIEWGLKKRGWQIYLSELYENLVIAYQNTLYLQSSTVQGRGAVILRPNAILRIASCIIRRLLSCVYLMFGSSISLFYKE